MPVVSIANPPRSHAASFTYTGDHNSTSYSPFHILLLVLVGSGSTLLLTQIVAYVGSAGDGDGEYGIGINHRLRNLSPHLGSTANDGTLLAATVYYSSSRRNAGAATAAVASSSSQQRETNEGSEATATTPTSARDGLSDVEERRITRPAENNAGGAERFYAVDGRPPAPDGDGRTTNEAEGEARRQSAATATTATTTRSSRGGGGGNGGDNSGGDGAETPDSLYFPRRSDAGSHKLFHDDIKMDRPRDVEEEQTGEQDGLWSEPDITSLDPSLVVTRNGVTHPSVAWLMSFPNRCVAPYMRRR
jgi:hypothetical protein